MRTDWVRAAILLAVGIVLTVLAGLLPGVLSALGYVFGVILIVVGLILLVAWALGRAP